MRDDPYPARFYGRQIDEPFLTNLVSTLPADAGHAQADALLLPLQQPLTRVLLLLMALYLCFALFLIFTVSSYAAPLESATISSELAAGCVEPSVEPSTVAAY